jgi:hypothetical protein
MIKEEQDYVIRIVGNDGEFLQITDLQNQYKGKIHKSLIEDNHFEMMDPKFNNMGENCYNVGKTCFEHWFKEEIAAAIKKQIDLFYQNIPLFVENQQMILSNPTYYSIVLPAHFYAAQWLAARKATLGELLQIWENESEFSTTCEKCGGKSVVYRFVGSILSGTLFETSNICVKCGNRGNRAGTHSFSVLRSARIKYKPIEPIAEIPDTIESLVETCKSKGRHIERILINKT